MGGLIELITRLGPARVAAIAGTGLLVMGFFVFMMFRVTTPTLTLLYGDLEADSARTMAEKLADQRVQFELRNGNTEIWVPEDQVSELRLSLAGDGLGGSVLGYEIFDRDSALGQSNLVQEVNRLRALEGELARTISGLSQVRSARVHIVLPRRELFTRDKQSPTASVAIRMAQSERFGREMVNAIQHLVATAVPDLQPDYITIVDNNGVLLHGGGKSEDGLLGAADSEELRTSYERRLANAVTEMIEQTLGFGKARVEVRAEMDFSQQVTNSTSYNPEQQVARSQENIVEGASTSEGTDGTVTVQNNLPDSDIFSAGAGGIQERSNRSEERTNFEIGNTTVNKVTPPGTVLRLSVAVLVDGSYIEEGDGSWRYEVRTDEELDKLNELVRSAVGFDAARGDVVELVNLQFASNIPEAEDVELAYFGYTIDELKQYAEWIGLGFLFLLIMLLVVRPLVARVLDFRTTLEEMEKADQQARLSVDQYGRIIHSPVPGASGEGEDEQGRGSEISNLIEIANVEGQVNASALRQIGELIDKHPEEAVAILRNWLYYSN